MAMGTGPKVFLGSLVVMLLAAGGMVYRIHYKNTHDTAPPQPGYAESRKLTDDDSVFLRKERPDSLKDERTLMGKTIWVSAADQMAFYADHGNHVDYAKPVGNLRGADPLVVTGVFEQVAPKSGPAVARIGAGQRQVLLAFTMPKSSEPKQLYAAPVGNYDNGAYTFLTDEIFFYDDPHTLYKDWGPEVWAHVDKHECVVGMSENECMLALGQVITPHGDTVGDRSVTYNNDNHPVDVEFRDGKATSVTPAKS